MPLNVNLPENERAGIRGFLGSLVPSDSKRMKYMLPLGPIVGLGLKNMDEVVATLTLAVIC